MPPLLDVTDVSFAYGQHSPTIIDSVSLSVKRQAILGLLGPNGAGKTTLLRLLSGTIAPSRGRVAFDGRPLSAFSRREIARHIAVVPQETHSAFDYTALEIVLMGRYPHLGALELERPDDLAVARDVMTATGTAELEAREFSTLSGGEKQRVIIASALAQASDVLLLDEPTASLDLGFQFEIARLLARLNRERATTMVLSTHDLNLAASLCTELVLVRSGRILAQGAVDAVLTPANVRALYNVDADVTLHRRAGHLTVVPVARAD